MPRVDVHVVCIRKLPVNGCHASTCPVMIQGEVLKACSGKQTCLHAAATAPDRQSAKHQATHANLRPPPRQNITDCTHSFLRRAMKKQSCSVWQTRHGTSTTDPRQLRHDCAQPMAIRQVCIQQKINRQGGSEANQNTKSLYPNSCVHHTFAGALAPPVCTSRPALGRKVGKLQWWHDCKPECTL